MQNSALSVNKVEVEVKGFPLPLWNVKRAYFHLKLIFNDKAVLDIFMLVYKSSVLRSNSLFPLNERCLSRPWWITPSSICLILHILRKPNSLIASFKVIPSLKS